MNMNTHIRLEAKGTVVPFIRTDDGDIPVGKTSNSIQTGGPEAVVRALANGSRITAVWFLHSSSSSPASAGCSGGALTAADFLAKGEASGNGILECPAFAVGVAKDGPNGADAATFISVTTPGVVKAGAEFADGRYVYAVGLVQSTPDGDVLYAACDLTPVAKAANSQIGVRWQTSITIG